MSGFEGHRRVATRSANESIPAAMVLAAVFAAGVVIFWGWVVLILVIFMRAVEGPSLIWTLGASFATAAGIVGVIGCLRRWPWVRWAALVQAVVVGAALVFAVPLWPSLVGVLLLLLAYAGLQFLPSSHRWYHPPVVHARPNPVERDS